MLTPRRFIFQLMLLFPAVAFSSTDMSLTSPSDGSSVTVPANQAVPVLVSIRNTTTGLGSIIPVYFVTQVTVTPSCPPAANPCTNYVVAADTVPPFILYGGHGFADALTTIAFPNAPAGFYSIKLAITIQACPNSTTCQLPDTFTSSTQFTAQVVSVGPGPANALPHFAVGGTFVTDLIVVNNGPQAAQFSVTFYNDSGAPASLPFNGLGTINALSDALPGFGTGFYEAADPNAPTQAGWALIKADPSITIQALFRNRSGSTYYEAAVPAYSGSKAFRIPFDASTFPPTGDALYTGFAIANLDPKNPAMVTCTARDYRGTTIPNAISVPVLNPLGHWANYLFPALTGARGTIECTSNNSIAGLGLRFIGVNAFSSLSVITE